MDYTQILGWLKSYKEKTQCKGVVVGLSGGKDSTVVAMLAKKIWGDDVLAVLMPNGIQSDLDDAVTIAKTLNLKYKIVNIGDICKSIMDTIEWNEYMDSNGLPYRESTGIKVTDKAQTNIPPRIRMTVLYAIAQTMGYRVIGTGNYSEAYVGWCTKWGDCAYDFNPIAQVTCTEVVELGKILARQFGLDKKFIIKSPADGLTGKTDEENLGFTYDDLDRYIMTGNGDEETVEKINTLHRNSKHKREMPKVCYFSKP